MDAALGLLKVVGEKLIECKRQFDILADSCDDILQLMEPLEHLARERAKECRFDGPVQANFVQEIRALRTSLLDIMDSLKDEKVKMFLCSAFGKGAAKANRTLQRHCTLLKDLLAVVQAESSNVTASATEEIAGGAAGKLIPHAGMRNFWREQFKNDFQLTWDQFLSGLMAFEMELRKAYGNYLSRVLKVLKLRLDSSRDGLVSVNEFSNFIKGYNLAEGADIVDVIEHHFRETKQLLPSISIGHSDGTTITACATWNHNFVTADDSGFVKMWLLLGDHIAEVGFTNVCATVSALHIAFYNEKMHLLVSIPTAILVIDVSTFEIVATLSAFAWTLSMQTENDFVFSSAPTPETRVVIDRRTLSPSDGGSLKFGSHGSLLHSASVRQMLPLGNDRTLVTYTFETGVHVWDYRSLTMTARLPNTIYAQGLVRAVPLGVRVLFGDREMLFRDVTKPPFESVFEDSPSIQKAVRRTTHVIDSHCAHYDGRQHNVVLGFKGTSGEFVTDVVDLPKSFRVEHVLCFLENKYVNVLVTGRIGRAPVIWVVKPPSVDQAARANGIVPWPTLRSVLGSRFWLGHTRVTLTPPPWVAAQPAMCALTPSTGKALIATSYLDRRVHLFDHHGSLVYQQDIGLSAKFSRHINFLASAGNHDVVALSADGYVMRFHFGGPYDIDRDRVGTENSVALEEVTHLAQVACSQLQPGGVAQFLLNFAHLSNAARPLVRKSVEPLKLRNKGTFTDADVTAIGDALAGLKLTLAQKESKDVSTDPRQPSFMKLPDESGKLDYRRFLSPTRWSSPAASVWLFDGSETCACGAVLKRGELIYQSCHGCTTRLDAKLRDVQWTPHHEFVECVLCEGRPSSPRFPYCDSCYDAQKRRLSLIPTCAAKFGNYILVGAVNEANLTVYGPASHLVKLDAESLRRVDMVQTTYPAALQNIAACDCLPGAGPFAAATLGYDKIGFFSGQIESLRASLMCSVDMPNITQALTFASAPVNGVVTLIASNCQQEVRVFACSSSAATSLTVVLQRQLTPATTVFGLALSGSLLFLGLRTGSVRIHSLDLDYAEVMEVQSHSTARIARITCAGDSVITTCADGTANTIPLSTIRQVVQKRKVAEGVLIKNSVSSSNISEASYDDSATTKTLLLVIYDSSKVTEIDSEWKYRASGSWHNVSVPDIYTHAWETNAKIRFRSPKAEIVELIMTAGRLAGRVLEVVKYEALPAACSPLQTNSVIGQGSLAPTLPGVPVHLRFDPDPTTAPCEQWLKVHIPFCRGPVEIQADGAVVATAQALQETSWIPLGARAPFLKLELRSLALSCTTMTPAAGEQDCVVPAPALLIAM